MKAKATIAFARSRALFAAALMVAAGSAFAAAGDLDTTFGGTGVVFVGPAVDRPNHWAAPYRGDSVLSVIVGFASDVGSARVYRTLEDGTADAAFGTGGSTLLSGGISDTFTTTDIASDKRGRVLVALEDDTRIRVYRLTSAGLADASFGTAGVAEIAIADRLAIVRIAAQKDRKVLIVTGELNGATGTHDLSVRRLNENGTLDATFGTGGVFRWQGPGPSLRTWGAGVGVQADGRIVVSGRYNTGGGSYAGYVLRVTAAGALDPTFGTGGYTSIVWIPGDLNSARHLVVMGDDRIVTGGSAFDPVTPTNASAVLARLNADGSFDATFGTGGKTIYPMVPFGGVWFNLGVASNDKVVLGGVKFESADQSQSSGNILRFRADGVIDTTFAGDGSFEYAPTSYVGGAQAFVDSNDRPIGVFGQGTEPTYTPANPVLVRLEAGKKQCP